jgi:hypothetical protein
VRIAKALHEILIDETLALKAIRRGLQSISLALHLNSIVGGVSDADSDPHLNM